MRFRMDSLRLTVGGLGAGREEVGFVGLDCPRSEAEPWTLEALAEFADHPLGIGEAGGALLPVVSHEERRDLGRRHACRLEGDVLGRVSSLHPLG